MQMIHQMQSDRAGLRCSRWGLRNVRSSPRFARRSNRGSPGEDVTASVGSRYRRAAVPLNHVRDRWRIRNATEADIASVLDLWAVAGSSPSISDTPDGLVQLLAADPLALLVAELDGVLAGSLIAAWDGWRGSFYRLAVSPEHRRKGLATMLLREGERRLRERGAVRLTAIVADDVAGAMDFGGLPAMSVRGTGRGSCARRMRKRRVSTSRPATGSRERGLTQQATWGHLCP
jgi:GNAT superfamily N-acetyltransferase